MPLTGAAADVLKQLPKTVDTIVHLAARAGVRPSIERAELFSRSEMIQTISEEVEGESRSGSSVPGHRR